MKINTEFFAKKRKIILGTFAGIILIWILIFAAGSIISWKQGSRAASMLSDNPLELLPEKELMAKTDRARNSLGRMAPRGIHIIIDSGQNLLYLKKGDTVLREAIVSCGSGNILEAPDGQKNWVFDTPRGVFSVNSRLSNPAWIKPDWAFIEEGEPVPTDPRLRYEPGVLGDYAIGFGDGYFIHGTLYTRLLGRNVTHGCVRVGDEDLKEVFSSVRIGTPIFIH